FSSEVTEGIHHGSTTEQGDRHLRRDRQYSHPHNVALSPHHRQGDRRRGRCRGGGWRGHCPSPCAKPGAPTKHCASTRTSARAERPACALAALCFANRKSQPLHCAAT